MKIIHKIFELKANTITINEQLVNNVIFIETEYSFRTENEAIKHIDTLPTDRYYTIKEIFVPNDFDMETQITIF